MNKQDEKLFNEAMDREARHDEKYCEINKAAHYNQHPSGVECIDVIEDMPFLLANAFKYCNRRKHKGSELSDLKKALYYVQRHIGNVEKKEIWQQYPHDVDYEISIYGRVRRKENKRVRKLVKLKNGYLTFLSKNKLHYVHRAVLQTFVGEPELKQECAHINGNKENNCLYNLRWCSKKSNLKDKHKHGTHYKGGKNPSVKLRQDQVNTIRAMKGSISASQCAKIYKVSSSTIGRIWRGEAWCDKAHPVVKYFTYDDCKLSESIWQAYISNSTEDLEKARYYIEREIERLIND